VVVLAVGPTAKNPAALVLPTNLITHPPAKGVGEVTDQVTYLPLVLYVIEVGVTLHSVIVSTFVKIAPPKVGGLL